MDLNQAINFLKSCYDAMQKGGKIRLPFPDLELWARKYLENDRDFLDTYHKTYLSNKDLKTRGEIFMSHVHGFGHKFAWDLESVKDILERAGFSNITVKNNRESDLPNIDEIESDRPGRILETKYVEAEKL
ncbi:hypothetical protein GF336_01850 [Candidatus Woesearchaeota archaeon]|nr:hypothetical protein [Candidatus Woesearchaeota archaeon]